MIKKLITIVSLAFATSAFAQETVLVNFTGTVTTASGNYPKGSLMQASDGMLYGMTMQGGANNKGVLFQYNPATNTYTNKLDFDSINGSSPQGSLMQATDGMLYGMTMQGATYNLGVLFQYNPATNTYSNKYNFGSAGINGYQPQGSLMQASDGMFYGMTLNGGGGTGGSGVLFQYNPTTNIYTKKIAFNGTTNGSAPYGSLMQATDGMLYGMTNQGGVNTYGVLFQYNPTTNTLTKKLDFASGPTGSQPYGDLMQATDGMIYGLTLTGGTGGLGILFQYNPTTNILTDKYDFNNTNGTNPWGSLMQASDGMLYGMTTVGGASNDGILFQYNPTTSTYTKKLDFTGTTTGSVPEGSLMQASDGMLYGMTQRGGTSTNCSQGCGVLFKYNIGATTAIQTHNQTGVNIFSYGNAIITNGTIAQGQQLKVINTLGQVVLTTALQNNIETNLPSGIYTIQVIDNTGSIIEIKKCALITK